MTTARLMLAGGNGRLVRRPSVVLFDPTGQNQDLANRFDAAASDSDAVDELKKYLIESGFTAAPLVVAEWARGEFNLLVFGEVEVHTSAIAAPMVSGVGSSTWVERHLGAIELGAATKVEVWSGEAADPTTNLGLGVVACAGFRMSLDLADLAPSASVDTIAEAGDGFTLRTDPPPARPMPVAADPTIAVPPAPAAPMPAPATPVPPTPVPPTPVPVVASVVADAPPVPPAPAPAPVAEAPMDPAFAADPAPSEVIEPIAAPMPGSAVSDWTETEDDAVDEPRSAPNDPFTAPNDTTPPSAIEPTPDSFRPDESLTEGVPPDAKPVGSEAASADEPPRAGLIEAAHCPQGHANPPRSSACYVCAESLLEDQSLGLIEQPTVGRIVFTGGQELSLERAVVMGRKPDAAAMNAHPVLIDHVEVSRSHAVVTIEGWTVLVTDQGSRNGTWVTPASDPIPVRLDEQVPYVLEHGTRVHLGAPEVQFTYYFDAT